VKKSKPLRRKKMCAKKKKRSRKRSANLKREGTGGEKGVPRFVRAWGLKNEGQPSLGGDKNIRIVREPKTGQGFLDLNDAGEIKCAKSAARLFRGTYVVGRVPARDL